MKKELGIICIVFQAYAMESPESNRKDINGPANSTSWRDESYVPSESRNSQEEIRSQEETLETNGKPPDWNISGITIDSGTSFVSEDVVHEHSFFAISAPEDSEEFSIIKSNNKKDTQEDIQHPKGAEWFQINSTNEFFAYLKLKKLYKTQDTNSPLWQLCLSQGYDPQNEPVPFMERSYFIEHFFQRHDFPIQAFNAVCGRCIEKLKNFNLSSQDYADIQKNMMEILEKEAMEGSLDRSISESKCEVWITGIVNTIKKDSTLKNLEKNIKKMVLEALSDQIIASEVLQNKQAKRIKYLGGGNIVSVIVIILGVALCSYGFSC